MPRRFKYTRPKNSHRKKQLPSVTSSISELQNLHSLLLKLPLGWIDQTNDSQQRIQLSKVQSHDTSSTKKGMPEQVTHCITVTANMSWTVHVHGSQLKPSPHSPLSSIPEKLSPSILANLVDVLERSCLCPGHPDENFLEMANSRKGKFTSMDGKVTAFIDELGGTFNGSEYPQTIRTSGVAYLYMEASVTLASPFDPC